MPQSAKPPTRYTIPQAAQVMGYTEGYIRGLIRKKMLQSTRFPISEGANVTKHWIEKAEIDRFMAESGHRARREDGRNKYILYATQSEIPLVKKALSEAGLKEVVALIRTANPIKLQISSKEAEGE